MDNGPLILIIDDEAQIRRFLRLSLLAHGYRVKDAAAGGDGLDMARASHPDCVILDLSLPDMDGKDLLAALRKWSGVPVIVLSVRSSEEDKIELLDAGAHDYLTKPFGMGELLARIRAVLRSQLPDAGQGVFRSGGLAFDAVRRTVSLRGSELRLTPTEYSLLGLLVRHAGMVVTSAQIVREIWGASAAPDPSYLRVYMLQLRRKIEDDPSRPKLLITEPGVGYRLIIIPFE